MREVTLNGYIDEETYFGDEITPKMLQEHLYGISGNEPNDIHITLNSYGGACNAATRMYDMIRSYPANVDITISGTAASAATVLASAARSVDMTPGSLYMIHDPSTIAWGNERELTDAINLLRACKDSILNIYELRSKKNRDELSKMMSDTTWMDAEAALAAGFVDRICTGKSTPTDTAVPRVVNRKDAEVKVAAYFERQHALYAHAPCGADPAPELANQPIEETPAKQAGGVDADQLQKRLSLIH